MVEDMFRRRRGVPLSFRLWLWFDDRRDWLEDNWDVVTWWVLASVGTGILAATFIV